MVTILFQFEDVNVMNDLPKIWIKRFWLNYYWMTPIVSE